VPDVRARQDVAACPERLLVSPSAVPTFTARDGTVTALTTLTKIGGQAVAAHDAQFDLPADDLASLCADLAARLSEHQPVLDAGCGSGLMLAPLRGAGLKVVGVDIDLDMVSVALGREPELRGRLAFADLAALAVRQSGFGSVHAAYVFHLFHDARPVLDELLRVTRPGGATHDQLRPRPPATAGRLRRRRPDPVLHGPVGRRRANRAVRATAGTR